MVSLLFCPRVSSLIHPTLCHLPTIRPWILGVTNLGRRTLVRPCPHGEEPTRPKMIEWQSVPDSCRIVAEAYDPEAETIYVRFPGGVEWRYSACPPAVWAEFTAPGQSRGGYIHRVLNYKPHGRHVG